MHYLKKLLFLPFIALFTSAFSNVVSIAPNQETVEIKPMQQGWYELILHDGIAQAEVIIKAESKNMFGAQLCWQAPLSELVKNGLIVPCDAPGTLTRYVLSVSSDTTKKSPIGTCIKQIKWHAGSDHPASCEKYRLHHKKSSLEIGTIVITTVGGVVVASLGIKTVYEKMQQPETNGNNDSKNKNDEKDTNGNKDGKGDDKDKSGKDKTDDDKTANAKAGTGGSSSLANQDDIAEADIPALISKYTCDKHRGMRSDEYYLLNNAIKNHILPGKEATNDDECMQIAITMHICTLEQSKNPTRERTAVIKMCTMLLNHYYKNSLDTAEKKENFVQFFWREQHRLMDQAKFGLDDQARSEGALRPSETFATFACTSYGSVRKAILDNPILSSYGNENKVDLTQLKNNIPSYDNFDKTTQRDIRSVYAYYQKNSNAVENISQYVDILHLQVLIEQICPDWVTDHHNKITKEQFKNKFDALRTEAEKKATTYIQNQAFLFLHDLENEIDARSICCAKENKDANKALSHTNEMVPEATNFSGMIGPVVLNIKTRMLQDASRKLERDIT